MFLNRFSHKHHTHYVSQYRLLLLNVRLAKPVYVLHKRRMDETDLPHSSAE